MPQDIIDTIAETIGGFFENPIIQFALQAMAVYVVILWLAAAYWAFRDMQSRSDNPILPYLAASLVVLFTPVFFVFGVVVYRIIRPAERIGEVYERNLAEEALLAEVESIKTCPTCSRRINDEWIICPSCRTRLNRVCPNCSRLVGLDWSLCAWCGRDFERRDIASLEPLRGGLGDTEQIDAPAPRPAAAGTANSLPPRTSGARASSPAPRPAPGPMPER